MTRVEDSRGDSPGDSRDDSRDAALVERGFWPKFRRVAARLPFAEDLLAAYFAAADPATPRRVRTLLLGALAYFVLPVDLIPDFVVGLGFTDDAAVLALALRNLAVHVLPKHHARAKESLIRALPRKDLPSKELPSKPAEGS